jgi:hypothetical protein
METSNSGGFRKKAEELLLKLVRVYTYHTLISKGKYRLYETALSLCGSRPDSIQVPVKDGRRFWVNLNTGMQETVFFLGEFERAVTKIAGSLVNRGDICIDVGANFGWYTTLFFSRAEPQLRSFRETVERRY